MTRTYFCCQHCPAEPWPEHKAWHVKVDAQREDHNSTGGALQAHREVAEQDARFAESMGSEHIVAPQLRETSLALIHGVNALRHHALAASGCPGPKACRLSVPSN